MGVEGEFADLSSDESDEDEDESEEVNMLKSKRRELSRLLRSGNTSSAPVSSARAHPRCVSRTCTSKLTSLRVVPRYSVVVIDANILLSPFSIFASLVKRLCWTILVPLAVITELDGRNY